MNSYVIKLDGQDYGSNTDYYEAIYVYNTLDESCPLDCDGHPKALVARINGEDYPLRKGFVEKTPEHLLAHRENAVVLMASGELKKALHKGSRFDLEELQTLVDGYIEVVPLDGKTVMVLNEEGKYNGLPYNCRASYLHQKYNNTGDFVVGDVVLCYSEEIR